jgi:hypothetical protein
MGNVKLVKTQLPYRELLTLSGLYLHKKMTGSYTYDNSENQLLLEVCGFENAKHVAKFGIYDPMNNNDLYTGIPRFDTVNSIVYDDEHDDYILYTRSNPFAGTRYIQYATSKDLTTFDNLKNIHLEPEYDYETENYYVPSIVKYPDTKYYVSLAPMYFNTKAKTTGNRMLYSKDRWNWKYLSDLRKVKYENDHYLRKTENRNDVVKYGFSNIICDENNMYFYMASMSPLNDNEKHIVRW